MEKFALLNLLNALQTLSAPKNSGENAQSDGAAPPPPVSAASPKPNAPPQDKPLNVMQSVLERHEAMSNRVKNRRGN